MEGQLVTKRITHLGKTPRELIPGLPTVGTNEWSNRADWPGGGIYGKQPDWWTAYDHLSLIDPNVYLGIEVEAEKIKYKDTAWNPDIGIVLQPKWWTIKPDGSLRNNGMEYISIPMRGMTVVRALSQLHHAYFDKAPDYSSRTSVHVHMNAQDLTLEQICNLYVVYNLTERLLFRWVGHNRSENIFCVPTYQTRGEGAFWQAVRDHFARPVSQKYEALNMNPLCHQGQCTRYGTVEFRHLHGTGDGERIVTWINMILRLRSFAKSMSLAGMIEEVNNLTNYHTFLRDVFQSHYDLLSGPGDDLVADFMPLDIARMRASFMPNTYAKAMWKAQPGKKSRMVKALRTQYGAFKFRETGSPEAQPAMVHIDEVLDEDD